MCSIRLLVNRISIKEKRNRGCLLFTEEEGGWVLHIPTYNKAALFTLIWITVYSNKLLNPIAKDNSTITSREPKSNQWRTLASTPRSLTKDKHQQMLFLAVHPANWTMSKALWSNWKPKTTQSKHEWATNPKKYVQWINSFKPTKVSTSSPSLNLNTTE